MEDDSEDGVFEYGDLHKIVLQGIMSAGFMDVKGVKNLFIGACKTLELDPEERTTMPAVQKVVREINKRVKPYDMSIRSASCEITGKKYYIFLVTVEKPIMKMQKMFSKGEMELFQKIMTAVLRKYEHFAVPETECLNMVREIDVRNFTIEKAEAFIQKMISLQYFAKYYLDSKNQDYEITIGFRTIREFEPILREVYDDVMSNCHLCKMIMLHGDQCPKCNVLVHKNCFEKYFKTNKSCPGCKCNWTEKKMLKRVQQTAKNSSNTQGTSNAKVSKRAGNSRTQNVDVDMPVLESMIISQKRGQAKGSQPSLSPQPSPKEGRKGKGKGRGKGKRRVVSSSEIKVEAKD